MGITNLDLLDGNTEAAFSAELVTAVSTEIAVKPLHDEARES
jgi:hypothetical protein